MGGTTRLLLPHHCCSTSCPQLVLESLHRIIFVTCSAAFSMDFEVRGPGIALKLILLWISAPWYALTHVPQACLSECCPQQGLGDIALWFLKCAVALHFCYLVTVLVLVNILF